MLLYSISFLLGICIIQQLAVLPETGYFSVLPVVILLALRYRSIRYSLVLRYISMALAGALWASVFAQQYLVSRLPEALVGIDILIEGKVIDIPVSKGDARRFVIDADSFEVQTSSLAPLIADYPALPKRLRLSWYYSDVDVKAGESWRFLVRLKPPHGFLNPGGFDYEAWLYQQGIHATGYVRKSELNQRLKTSDGLSVDALRQSLFQKINHHLVDSEYRGLITALAVGNRSSIPQNQWDDLIKTGTNHLMAISGLHIGLAAAFGYWITRRILPAAVMEKISAQQISIAVGVFFAVGYALLAGLSIPTQRALIMLVCIVGAILLKRHFNPANGLSIALLLVLLIDPVSVLSAGFWFSFLAVAVIFYVFRKKSTGSDIEEESVSGFNRSKVWRWGGLQLVIALALFPISLLMFQQTSLIAPIANFVLVPFVSFLVVPLVLLAIVFFVLYEPVALFLLDIANALLGFIWSFLHFLADMPLSHWVQNVAGLGVTLLALSGIAIMLSQLNWRIRTCGALLIFPLFISSHESPLIGGFDMLLLDVGQGLSVIIRTRDHVLVYDTGARFSDELDSGEAVVLPVLRTLGVAYIDKLIISHGDNDHIGGAESILDAFPHTQIIGQDIQALHGKNKITCQKGFEWEWDGVHFAFLHPDEKTYKKRNNRSCVLKVTGVGGSLLLTGDIEKKIEKQLLKTRSGMLDIDVVVVPHHGSKTSSSQQWLEAITPKMSLFAAGYRNRYRLPSQDIVQRYRELSSERPMRLLSTASSGAIRLKFHPEKGLILEDQYRMNQAKYWNHRAPQF